VLGFCVDSRGLNLDANKKNFGIFFEPFLFDYEEEKQGVRKGVFVSFFDLTFPSS
jgi:hypothetical protein